MAEQQKRKFERKPREEVKDEFERKNVSIRRVNKTTKGGRNMSFSSLVVAGNKKGMVGMGLSKAIEVPAAIEKAGKAARKAVVAVPVVNGTIPHAVTGKFAKTSVKMLPSKPGTGVIAGGAARSVFELAGYTDITSKIHGSTNKINTVRATLNALKNMRTAEQIAMLRGKSVEEL